MAGSTTAASPSNMPRGSWEERGAEEGSESKARSEGSGRDEGAECGHLAAVEGIYWLVRGWDEVRCREEG